MMEIDEMYEKTRELIAAELNGEGLPSAPTYWVVVSDETGVACARIEPSRDPTAALHALGDRPGVRGAALVSYVRPHGAEKLLGYVRVRRPETSDIRRASVSGHEPGAIEVGPWEYLL